jgi:YggT family protein
MNPFLWLILTVLDLYKWILIASIIVSWLIAFGIINMQNPYARQANYALRRLTEPVLGPIRRVLPDLGGLDFSPLVAFLGIMFLQQAIVYYLAPLLMG